MSKLSEYNKERKNKAMDYFFNGGWERESNKYFTFNRVIDNDNIIIVTDNIKILKDNHVLVVNNNQVVYLKDWQIHCVHNYYLEVNAYVVKLNRNYFKPYTFSFNFDDMSFDKADTFDSLYELAKKQNEENLKWAFGII